MSFSPYSIPDLAGLVATSALSIIFYFLYGMFGRRRANLLFANQVGTGTLFCLFNFLTDNVVPQGVAASSVPGAAAMTLWWAQLEFVAGAAFLVCQIHFVMHFARVPRTTRRWMIALYAALPLVALSASSSWFLRARATPSAQYTDWLHAAPWWPPTGPLALVFLTFYLFGEAYCLITLTRIRSRSAPIEESLEGFSLIRGAALAMAVAGVVDILAAGLGYTGVACSPPATMIFDSIVAAGLIRSAIHERHRSAIRDRDLNLAADIQRALLPPAAPQIPEFDLAGWCRFAEQTGGDTYDFGLRPDGQCVLTLADASGHGLGAAMVIAETQAILRAVSVQADKANEILNLTQRVLVMSMPSGRFVTCFVGLLHPVTHVIEYASAGHAPLIFYDASADRLEAEDASQPPLGADLDAESDVRCRRLDEGDFVAIPSDGLWEAFDPQGRTFGIKRLMAALRETRELTAAQMIARIQDRVARFMGGSEQKDDMTMIVLRRTGRRETALQMQSFEEQPQALAAGVVS